MNLPKDKEAKAAEAAEATDASIGEALQRKPLAGDDGPQASQSEFGRAPLNQPKNLDADPYILEYPDKKLMWVNAIQGDVERWIDAGADPVPVKTKRTRHFEGITTESEWVRVVGGENKDGSPFWVYLLMIDPALYDQLVTEPEQRRQQRIHQAMKLGGDQSGGAGAELQSYAPNLPTGDRGMNVAQEVEQ